MPHDIFISYSSHDRTVADATCAALEAQKIRCWIAPRDVLAGTEYGEALLSAIEECRAMVLVFSAHANESPHIRREVERAVSKGKIILPFRIENVLPSRAMEYCLANTHWLDALTPPIETRIEELVATVRRLLARETSSTPSPQPVRPRTPTQTQSEIAPESDGAPVDSEQAPKRLNDRTADSQQSTTQGQTLACKIHWAKPPYSTLTLHVDRPLFEKFIGDWFYRGREGDNCPELYRLLLRCPGIESVSRSGPYALLMGHSELAEPEQALPCIIDALRVSTGFQPSVSCESFPRPKNKRSKK